MAQSTMQGSMNWTLGQLRTFVAVAPPGTDPCDLRQRSGDAAVRDLVARRTPMFKFAIKAALAEHDLDTGEGRRGDAPTVLVDVDGLDPATTYHYAFTTPDGARYVRFSRESVWTACTSGSFLSTYIAHNSGWSKPTWYLLATIITW